MALGSGARTPDPRLDLSGTKAACFQGTVRAAHLMTSVTETEHGVPDAGRTEVATKMNTRPCVCGRIPPQTWWLFPICKQGVQCGNVCQDPHFVHLFSSAHVLGRDHKLPLPVLQATVCSPQILQRVDLGCETWGKQCSVGRMVWGAGGRAPKSSFLLGVESAQSGFPGAGSVWLLANTLPG